MEDVKWLLKRYGSLIVLMAVIVITGSIALGRRDTERNAEEVWGSPVVIESTEAVKEDEPIECFGEEPPNPAEAPIGEKAEPVSILTAEEEQGLQDEAMSAAEQCMELYKEIEIAYPETEYSHTRSFSEKQRKDVVKQLVQSFYVSVGWREGGIPEIKGFGSNDLEEIRLTEKGYFIYTNTEVVAHGNLREYYRVKPLSDECRELTRKYIYGLSFVNYNMLVTNWDADNAEKILMPCMFEDIYRIYTNEPFRAEDGLIPGEIYECVMTTCFPVSVEQVREYCGYHADAGGHEYEMIFARQFPPFGEV
ncbi:hypothetical protein AMURIS_03111 [Acetatifactor muris]|uniref:Uncharacterized protein n=1 Tax=Acetatifactor muris TaxID=879566 RepID=A0A2K4ZIT9_9FIRM|nr:DUF6070 family protein [Acetatifactor muris]SOY30384.1 hypothetical protein AMURIS_03111 [Acetatifactor muris]